MLLYFSSILNVTLISLSAGLIFVFYLLFYIFLAGMFTLTMYVMLQTLDDHKPTWQDRLTTPGAVATNNKNCRRTGQSLCRSAMTSVLSLCQSQAWWLDPKQMRPLRLSITSRKPRAGTCTLRPWTTSCHVSLSLLALLVVTQKAYCCGLSNDLNCFVFFYLIRDNSFWVSWLEIALHQGF